jgi:hypothetical protein
MTHELALDMFIGTAKRSISLCSNEEVADVIKDLCEISASITEHRVLLSSVDVIDWMKERMTCNDLFEAVVL